MSIPPLKLNSYVRYEAHVCRVFTNPNTQAKEYFWRHEGWEMETYAEVLNYIRRCFPNMPPERYRIVEINVSRNEVTQ